MTSWRPVPASVPTLTGSPEERGRQQAEGAPQEEVRAAIRTRLEAARKGSGLGSVSCDYLKKQWRFSFRHCRTAMAELSGIAQGFGISQEDLFTHQHLGILADLARTQPVDEDGCSAWAVTDGPDGPLVVKNRDFSGKHLGIQRIFRHEGPDLVHGPILCLGSLGSPGAYSSGMNAAGLAVVDTQVGVRHHGTGWVRYFLMTEILARCATVEDAIGFIRSVPHAGGGTLVLGDRGGAVAAIELATFSVTVDQEAPVFRTNHFVSAELVDETLLSAKSRIDDTSAVRFSGLEATLPGKAWDAASAVDLMSGHGPKAPLCQHRGQGETQTIASVVYCCRDAVMYACLDNPCSGSWQRISLAT